jgi:hypothetical protein
MGILLSVRARQREAWEQYRCLSAQGGARLRHEAKESHSDIGLPDPVIKGDSTLLPHSY